ncbi:type 2 lantipeptide synthetase LanM family protein [Virgibacillus pantothenticus]|uniref:type 2 lanthipeptide synthetase LanM family protein n=1 Tax=Virgibacillus pantothenticus TaxID=1473 RepID=UPI001C2134D1|nr:type 2 lanthipeptide synthetase LanM family protein [Virgibacillus pantothenticus]MBU8568839.1 type 2 lantipeptide synthetase LanM family protein [Virgibacillus pantothenticus]MBU8602884.1 type 2 lantipeptide synthetase LanM family protein [Virgibacillus pantothenticus]MBU8636991.1 type 2 lantipeptide synthetase LanM family protein [Virgibacillus pantothenticus]MBU8644730.1 type 2 lantipeptide synthetase LanM family protein [Virgibacillus pantothenticus]MBU8648884.1 type 2 lantipeptide synt
MEKLNYFIENLYKGKGISVNNIKNALKELNIPNLEYLHKHYYIKNRSLISNFPNNDNDELNYNKLKLRKIESKDNNKNLLLFTDLFLELYHPHFTKKFNVLKELVDIDFCKEEKNLTQQISHLLMSVAHRTLIYDINKKRILKDFNSDDEKEQYTEYIEEYLSKQNEFIKILKENDTLVSIMKHKVLLISNYIDEFLRNLINDIEEIIDYYNVNKNQEKVYLSDITINKGDTHNKGKSVVSFDLNGQKIYYKPRNGSIDLFYEKVLKHFNEHSNYYSLKYPRNIYKLDYFWSESIDYYEIESKKDISDFYLELGIHLSFLYAFNAVDFHSENLIANGKCPVLIDLESLFNVKSSLVEFQNASDVNQHRLAHSVKSTGVLPFTFGNNKSDISGIGRRGDTQTFIKVPTIQNERTSNVKIVSEYKTLQASQNHPKYKNQHVNELEYIGPLKEGFTIGYKFICDHKKHIVNTIKSMRDEIELRYINKPTIYYANILNVSHHPVFLENRAVRDLLLIKPFIEEGGKLSKLEAADLAEGDIPYFKYRLSSREILHNSCILKNFLKDIPLDFAVEKLENLSKEDLSFQLELISNSLVDDKKELTEKKNKRFIKDFSNLSLDNNIIDRENYLYNFAFLIEEEISKQQTKYNNTFSWYTSVVTGDIGTRKSNLFVMDGKLYDGLSGMAFLYISKYSVTKNKKYIDKAQLIIDDILASYGLPHKYPIGAFDGISSLVYVLAYFYKTTKINKYKEKAIEISLGMKENIKKDKTNDIISGASGVMLVLINLYNLSKDSRIKNLVEICKDTLINNAEHQVDGTVSWRCISDQYLTGFAHGNSGICYSLNKYVEDINSNDVKVKEIIKQSNEFEEKLRSENKWLGGSHDYEDTPYAWCHGSPGILLNRISSKMSEFEDNQKIKSEILKNGFSRTQCLCHGDLGTAMILKDFYTVYKQHENYAIPINIIYNIIKNKEVNEIKSGLGINNIQTPDLMIGLAGTAYGLLYITNHHLPNILKLEL